MFKLPAAAFHFFSAVFLHVLKKKKNELYTILYILFVCMSYTENEHGRKKNKPPATLLAMNVIFITLTYI